MQLLNNLDLITEALVEKAKQGGTTQLKLLWELGKLHQDAKAGAKTCETSLSELLMQELVMKGAVKKTASPRK